MKDKLPKGITGIAGEYHVAAELSRRGYMAAITLRNNDSVDILACDQKSLKTFSIQVKTVQFGIKKWPLNKKAETLSNESLFYVFVLLKDKKERPEFYIVPSIELSKNIKKQHQDWLNTPGKKGQKHNDSDIRSFREDVDKYYEKWDLIK